jgi:hypothetical protein
MVDQSKLDRMHSKAFAKGGKDRMFRAQAAGPAMPGIAGKNQTPAPGARAVRGVGNIGDRLRRRP